MKNNTLHKARMLIATLVTLAGVHVAAGANTHVKWSNPDDYTDLGTDFHDEVTLEGFRDEIEPYINRIANKTLPDGSLLEMTVTNVDLAGEYEPWRLNNDVRIVRSIYPPRMSFTYKLFNINGDLIASGEETIADIDFDYNIGRRFFQSDGFFYEKELISSWIRHELADSVES